MHFIFHGQSGQCDGSRARHVLRRRRRCHTSYPGPLLVNRQKFFSLSIDSCHNKVSADQFSHDRIAGSSIKLTEVTCFIEVNRWPKIKFVWSQACLTSYIALGGLGSRFESAWLPSSRIAKKAKMLLLYNVVLRNSSNSKLFRWPGRSHWFSRVSKFNAWKPRQGFMKWMRRTCDCEEITMECELKMKLEKQRSRKRTASREIFQRRKKYKRWRAQR